MYSISCQKEFLKVDFNGEIQLSEVLEAIIEIQNRDDFHHLNTIWVFNPKIFDIGIAQLKTIAKAAISGYPENATRTKSAIVTPSGFMTAIGQEFLLVASDLPSQLRIFTSYSDAEDWVRLPSD